MTTENWQRGGFGIYIHWPFCQAKCPYCDFNSHVSASIDQTRWQAAYLSELNRAAAVTADCIVSTVFFGGGTPSLMNPELVGAILERIRKNWRCTNDIEITLEANPTSVEAGPFQGFRDAGINRISMGIQALNDADLKTLGRLHTVEDAKRSFDIAQHVFDRVSFDLIYARQHQTLKDWELELSEALSMATDHLSLYQLTIEDGTAFGDRYSRGRLPGLPTDDYSADMFELTQDITATHGLSAYEVSNHARPGQESRHNFIYWRGGDYVGIGPGAHGRITTAGTRYATETHLTPGKWLAAAESDLGGESLKDPQSASDQAIEYLLMSLRLAEGCDLGHLESLADNLISDNKINSLISDNRLSRRENRLVVPAKSRILLNAILSDLVT